MNEIELAHSNGFQCQICMSIFMIFIIHIHDQYCQSHCQKHVLTALKTVELEAMPRDPQTIGGIGFLVLISLIFLTRKNRNWKSDPTYKHLYVRLTHFERSMTDLIGVRLFWISRNLKRQESNRIEQMIKYIQNIWFRLWLTSFTQLNAKILKI